MTPNSVGTVEVDWEGRGPEVGRGQGVHEIALERGEVSAIAMGHGVA
jgi:hypothetical protein